MGKTSNVALGRFDGGNSRNTSHSKPGMLIGFTLVAALTTIVVYLDWVLGFVNVYALAFFAISREKLRI